MTDSSYDGTNGAQMLKTDVLGRVKTSKIQRERLLDEFERSGLSGTKFAAVGASITRRLLPGFKNPNGRKRHAERRGKEL